MSSRDDNRYEMANHLSSVPTPDEHRASACDPDAVLDALLADLAEQDPEHRPDPAAQAELAETLRALHRLGHTGAPLPAAELAAEFRRRPAVLSRDLRAGTRRHRVVVATALAGAMTAGLTGVAAASNRLPSGAQRVVSRVIDDYTPFQVDQVPHQAHSPGPSNVVVTPTAPAPPATATSPPVSGEPSEPGGAAAPGSTDPAEPAEPSDSPAPGAPGRSSEPTSSDSPDPGDPADPAETGGTGRPHPQRTGSQTSEPTGPGESEPPESSGTNRSG